MPPQEHLLKISDVLTVAALILGPVLAVQAQKWIEEIREVKNRRLSIFKTLMATRGALLSVDHVSALNRIDLEFTSNKDKYKKVINAWKEYFDVLAIHTTTNEESIVWFNKREDKLADLLWEMGCSLGFKFDKVLIKRNVYSPMAHGRIEDENKIIRTALIDLLTGKTPLPINVEQVAWNEAATKTQFDLQERQSKLCDIMIEYYTRENNKHKPT